MGGKRKGTKSISAAMLALLGILSTPIYPADNASSRLELGVFPYLSARALLDLYEPVRMYLQDELNRPTKLFTASSFKVYVDRTQQGEYDVVLTPPHLARLAQREAGYIPIAIVTRELRGVVVVAKNSPYQSLVDLKGRRIAMPSKLALVTIVGGQLLRDAGLSNEMGTLLRDVGSHSNAVLAVQRNEAEAALTENAALQQLPEEIRNNLRIIAQTQRLPHVMFLVHPRLGYAGAEKVRAALLQFPLTAEGRAFLKSSGFEGLRGVEEADLRAVDPFMKEVRQYLETTAN